MSAANLWVAGYKDLVSVTPPDAELAPTTRLQPAARGKAPGIKTDRGWVGYSFLTADVTTEDIRKWHEWESNVGLKATHYPGLDVDCDDAQLADLVAQEAKKHLGPAPARWSTGSRRLLAYRTDEPFARLAATIEYRGEVHTVEMLGQGRQYVVYGEHPSGAQYTWDTPLWEVPPDDLTPVTQEDVLQFFGHLEDLLQGRAHVEVRSHGGGGSGPPQEELKAPSMEELEEVVGHIPNDYPDRQTYIQMAHAIRAAGGSGAFPIWEEWCGRWDGGTNPPATIRADWESLTPPFRVGWSWLLELAEERGYNRAAREFDVEVEEPPNGEVEGLLSFTDTWVVAQLVQRLHHKLRYVPETSQFYVWGSG